MDWDFRTEYAKNYSVSVQRAADLVKTMFEVSFLRSAIVGADSSTVRNVPEPGPGAIGPRRPVPELANITAIRWDGYSIYNGVTFRAEQRLSRGLAVHRLLHAVEGDRRCLGSRRHRVRSQPAAGRAQHGRRKGAMRASIIAIASSPALSYALPGFGGASGLRLAARLRLAGQRDRAARIGRAVHGEPGHRPREHRRRPGAAARSDLRSERGRRADRTTVVQHQLLRAAAAVHVRQRAAQLGPRTGLCDVDTAMQKDVVLAERHPAAVPLGDLQSASTTPTSTCRTGSPSPRTSAASSAPSRRGRCSSA